MTTRYQTNGNFKPKIAPKCPKSAPKVEPNPNFEFKKPQKRRFFDAKNREKNVKKLTFVADKSLCCDLDPSGGGATHRCA